MLNWFFRRRRGDPEIDRLIKPPRQVFTDHDEPLRKRTETKRARAADIKREAVQIETEPERPRVVQPIGSRRR